MADRTVVVSCREMQQVGGSSSQPVFGYRRVADGRPEIDHVEAGLLRLGIGQVLQGRGVNSIARSFCESGVDPPIGKSWTIRRVREALTAPQIAGFRLAGGRLVADSELAPIVTKEEWHCALSKFGLLARQHLRECPILPEGVINCVSCQKQMSQAVWTKNMGSSPEVFWECTRADGGCGLLVRDRPLAQWIEKVICGGSGSNDLAANHDTEGPPRHSTKHSGRPPLREPLDILGKRGEIARFIERIEVFPPAFRGNRLYASRLRVVWRRDGPETARP